ncbi:hypothetical protein [Mucilaginibacter sp.]|uniref:hypothetical protein n=1 Tax=Mucilaginibacter sp. TaxID=1882438 RepID=UPI00261558B0|nr:hypothetical protein [Mucilaginibacter sp.]
MEIQRGLTISFRATSSFNCAGVSVHMDNAGGIYNTMLVLQNRGGRVLKINSRISGFFDAGGSV